LFMSSLLMDLKYKKLFAVRFAKVSTFSVLKIYKISYMWNNYNPEFYLGSEIQ
jgi:hypothetical protein